MLTLGGVRLHSEGLDDGAVARTQSVQYELVVLRKSSELFVDHVLDDLHLTNRQGVITDGLSETGYCSQLGLQTLPVFERGTRAVSHGVFGLVLLLLFLLALRTLPILFLAGSWLGSQHVLLRASIIFLRFFGILVLLLFFIPHFLLKFRLLSSGFPVGVLEFVYLRLHGPQFIFCILDGGSDNVSLLIDVGQFLFEVGVGLLHFQFETPKRFGQTASSPLHFPVENFSEFCEVL